MFKNIILIVIGIAVGVYATTLFHDKGDDKFVSAYPITDFYSSCVAANDSEKRVYSLVNELFLVAEEQNLLWIGIGIQKFLASGITRREGENSVRVCPPLGFYNSIGESITKTKALEARLEDYQLRVMQKIENPTPYIVAKAEDIAFSKNPYIEVGRYSKDRIDLRPRARIILAQNKEASKKVASKAYSEISAKDPLGTSAAQIAAKANYKDSLQIIESLMNEIIDVHSNGEAIGFEARDRFRELGYALILAGEPARSHTAPLEKILDRKVKSWAGHFGAVELSPKRMCLILNQINPDNEITKKYDYCSDKDYPFAQ